MKIEQYQIEAKRTCPTLGSDKLDLAHMVLGIFSEFEEFTQAVNNNDMFNKSEECSDMMWYISNYCTFRFINLDLLWYEKEFNGETFIINVSILQDYVKKYIAYNRNINPEKEEEILKAILYNISKMYGMIDVEKSLQNNIDKLKVRFPDKFSEELANNRNLTLERKKLEQL
jgi:NTP pyrophosphatase (non-canonical NTP hydrolase)